MEDIVGTGYLFQIGIRLQPGMLVITLNGVYEFILYNHALLFSMVCTVFCLS